MGLGALLEPGGMGDHPRPRVVLNVLCPVYQ
ncbi:hypothetical protein A2U01_0095724, partial [Trifolium medium]|nr:hypothetical protein [Trifolium medium]